MVSSRQKRLIPFFVVDRPASLRILSGLSFPDEHLQVGLMTHANTTERFVQLFREFPCGEPDYCKRLHGGERHPNGLCSLGKSIATHFVKMGDSGVFSREGCTSTGYTQLFEKYTALGVDYGIIIDVLKDPRATLESARRAMDAYKRLAKSSFKLVGVTQGNSVEEYVSCYRALKLMGYDKIAVGGLLRKKEKSAHFVHVRDEHLMYEVLRTLRLEWPTDWLFPLGTYHPKRHNRLDALSAFGADYKGWIFHYPEPKKWHSRRWEDRRRYRAVRGYIEREVIKRVTGEVGNRNLLVLGCSKAKRLTPSLLPAIERYDGPTFQMVRGMFFDGLHLDVDLAILSGKYGLLPPDQLIPSYDFRLRPNGPLPVEARAWRTDLLRQIESKHYKEVFLAMGPDYVRALGDLHQPYSRTVIRTSKGRNGIRLAQTKRWLLSKSNRATPSE